LKVVFTPLAERQLDSLYEYIATHADPARADSYVGRVVAYCETLKTFPRRGQKRDDLISGLRILVLSAGSRSPLSLQPTRY